MADPITIFMCGDVMTGRGIDQVLPHPGNPVLHEPHIKNALGYVALAELQNGPIPRPVSFSYIWGDTLDEFRRKAPDFRLINLETAVTRSDDLWPRKTVLYRMSPENIPCITSAGIDYCSLANNHTLDWGYPGLQETLESLKEAGVAAGGAGRDLADAEAPAIFPIAGKGRLIIFSIGSVTSGIPGTWAASARRPGVHLLERDDRVAFIRSKTLDLKRKGDIVVVSVHWGGNWGYGIPESQTELAHRLIDGAGVDVVHGHSSHHVKAIEVYREKLVLYGCGDFLNDYEGIGGNEEYRGDLGLMYFAGVDPAAGNLASLRMTPTQIRNFRVNRAGAKDAGWLAKTLSREGREFGTTVEMGEDGRLALRWQSE